jgi:acyl carrier protein
MTNGQISDEQIRMALKRLIAQVTEREPEDIPDGASFRDELGVDSLMAMEVMVAVDKKFQIDIPEEEFNTATTIDAAVALVKRYLPQDRVAVAGISSAGI